MITLEQIRLLDSKITRAIELIRVLKDENGTLRKGLESAQKRMKELETLVDGFKTDQREIETVIVRTLRNLDDLEENATAGKKGDRAAAGPSPEAAPAPRAAEPGPAPLSSAPAGPATKEELDIF
ncbi:MAG TPA: cell division protein ZapB [Spirochaetia bacterium]|nr:cell division protein ZapB [Spirochaetia bacterium]